MLFCDGDEIQATHLPPEVRGSGAENGAGVDNGGADGTAGLKAVVKEATAKLERELIVRALEQTGGNVTHTARLLKISRKSLQTKMKELGLRSE